VFSAGSRRCSFKVVVVSSISTAVGDASPALLLFKVECWCLIASAENTPGLKNNAATIIVVVASVILFEITEDCRRRIHDDLISSLCLLLRRERFFVWAGVSLFPRDDLKIKMLP
jgi:hypothetical protein